MPITINGTTASVTGLANGTMYRFRVAARNGLGYGPYSAPTSPGTPSGAAPPPPAAKPADSWATVSGSIRVLGFANSKFIGVGPLSGAQSSYMYHSANGTTWSAASGFVSANQAFLASSVAFGGGTWVGACYSTSSGSAQGLQYGVSGDGTSWSPVTAPLEAPWVGYDTTQFVAVRTRVIGGNSLVVSSNGLSWSNAGLDTGLLLSAAAGRGFYGNAVSTNGLVAGTLSTKMAGTADPFVATPVPADTTPVYGGSGVGWIAATTGNTYYTSSNGTSWTQRSLPAGLLVARPTGGSTLDQAMHRPNPSAIAYGNGWWVALATTALSTQSRIVLRSQDGITWETVFTLPSVALWDRIAFGSGTFVATGVLQTGQVVMAVTQ